MFAILPALSPAQDQRPYASGPFPMNWISVASGVRLLKWVSLTLAMPRCPLSRVSQMRSLGRNPSAVRDMNSPCQDWRPELESVTVTRTSTAFSA